MRGRTEGRAGTALADKVGRAAAGDRAETSERVDMKVGMKAGKGNMRAATAEMVGMAGRAVWAGVLGREGLV